MTIMGGTLLLMTKKLIEMLTVMINLMIEYIFDSKLLLIFFKRT